MEKLQRNRLERAVQEVNEDSKEWLRGELKAILESNKPYQAKCDHIGYSILSIDEKINLLDEEIGQLKEYKLKLQEARNISLELGAEIFNSYGIAKIEGGGISSITTSLATVANKLHFVSLNEEEFIAQGFYKKVIDKEKILQYYKEGSYLDFIEANAKIIEISLKTPAKLRINKRRASNNTININMIDDLGNVA